jgi:hypothetical protein
MRITDAIMSFFKAHALSPEQKRERDLMSRYQLSKDPDQPFTYWINDRHLIRFNPGDLESVQNAEVILSGYYRHPSIERGNRNKQNDRATRAAHNRSDQTAWRDLTDVGMGFQDVADYFTNGIKHNPTRDDLLR